MRHDKYCYLGLLCWLIMMPLSATPLPYQSTAKHLGVASCASSVCHGSIQPNDQYNIPLNEYVIWSQRDSHARAYEILLSKESRAIASKLGLPDVHTARICLDCHADNVPQEQRGDGFQLSDGVGCEACHGGSEHWLETHSAKESTHQQNIKRGLYPTADFQKRATLCLSCHYGNDDKFATHQIMGAGHPRLSFELDTFQALQPVHFQIDDDYKKRKPTASHTKIWALGQIAATLAQLHMLQGRMINQPFVFPELALFDCHACHNNSMHRLDWQPRKNTMQSKPGSVPIADGHLRMASVIAGQVAIGPMKTLIRLSRKLQQASGGSRDRIVDISRQLEDIIEKLSADLRVKEFDYAEKDRLLMAIINMGVKGEFRDYIGAEQAVMAIELIIIDMDKRTQFRKYLDDLYSIVKNDDAFQSAKFINALKELKTFSVHIKKWKKLM